VRVEKKPKAGASSERIIHHRYLKEARPTHTHTQHTASKRGRDEEQAEKIGFSLLAARAAQCPCRVTLYATLSTPLGKNVCITHDRHRTCLSSERARLLKRSAYRLNSRSASNLLAKDRRQSHFFQRL
jgi:hypothetical protein